MTDKKVEIQKLEKLFNKSSRLGNLLVAFKIWRKLNKLKQT